MSLRRRTAMQRCRQLSTSRPGTSNSLQLRKTHVPDVCQVEPAYDATVDLGLIRILVVDEERSTLDRIENALWVWPHKVSLATSLDEAIRMCQHLQPTALIAAIDGADSDEVNTVASLRAQLPNVPIIALGSPSEFETRGEILDQGADALLLRDDAHRSTLYDLLVGVQQQARNKRTLDFPVSPELSLPWRESGMIGSLICDISGSIVRANSCLARWLEYPDSDALCGKSVWHDLLCSRDDWAAWKQVAGDTAAHLHRSASMMTKNGQVLWMKVEVFAAPSCPSHLQAAFMDLTELALLKGRGT